MQQTENLLTAEEYLLQAYDTPEEWQHIPMPDEPFVSLWEEKRGQEMLLFLKEKMKLPAYDWDWENAAELSISFVQTMGGSIPVLAMDSHKDFRQMEALLNGREEARELPLTVNAFAMQARANSILRHRILLLNRAPYSNIPAARLGLDEDDWLERSHKLRLRHECAHYETLRLLGGMKNHALDEIIADALGQIAAFGNFDADRQRIFLGIEKGKETCNGRLAFYCPKVMMNERHKIYSAVDKVLDDVAEELNEMISAQKGMAEILMMLAGTSLAERIARLSQ